MKYLRLLRAHHWIKNIFLFAPPFFGGKLLSAEVLYMALPAFVSFSLTASSLYILNDIVDRHRDRLHPAKKLRPIASGQINIQMAILVMLLLLIPSLYLAYKIGYRFLLYVMLYIFIQVGYTLSFKNQFILDIFCIGAGFVIRVMAGGEAFYIKVSPWLFATMFMISLVLASGKRLSEYCLLGHQAFEHRLSLNHYPEGLLKEILLVAASAALITYALYTIEENTKLVYTLPVVTYGLFRYLFLVKKGAGDATEALLKDRPLALTVTLWLLMVWLLRYTL